MKPSVSIFLLALIFSIQVYSQVDTASVYKNLEVKKIYAVTLKMLSDENGKRYWVNGQEVGKETYEKYNSYQKRFETCCPCILKEYDEQERLLSESVSCIDCGVGAFKEYFPNGKVKLIGQFKENPTGDWADLWERGYCNVRDGKWTYFAESGDTLYFEYWNNGEFLKQVPEQKSNEIWKVELALNGEKIKNQILSPEDVKNLAIVLKRKNNSSLGINISIKFEVYAIGKKMMAETFTPENFKNIDLRKMISESGIAPKEPATFLLQVLNNEKPIRNFFLNIEH